MPNGDGGYLIPNPDGGFTEVDAGDDEGLHAAIQKMRVPLQTDRPLPMGGLGLPWWLVVPLACCSWLALWTVLWLLVTRSHAAP